MSGNDLSQLLDLAFERIKDAEGGALIIGGRASNFTRHDELVATGRFTFMLGEAEMGNRAFPVGTRVVFLTRWRAKTARRTVSERAEREDVLFVDIDASTGLFNNWSKRVLEAWKSIPAPEAPVVEPAPAVAPIPAVSMADASPVNDQQASPSSAPETTSIISTPQVPVKRGELLTLVNTEGNLTVADEGLHAEVDRLFSLARDFGLPTTRASVQNAFYRARKSRAAAAVQSPESPQSEVETKIPVGEQPAAPAESSATVAENLPHLDFSQLLTTRMGNVETAKGLVLEAFHELGSSIASLDEGVKIAIRQGTEHRMQEARQRVSFLEESLREKDGRIARLEADATTCAEEMASLRLSLKQAQSDTARLSEQEGAIANLRKRLALYERLETAHPVLRTLRTTAEQLESLAALPATS